MLGMEEELDVLPHPVKEIEVKKIKMRIRALIEQIK
jgi:hypothetical protein